MPEPKAATKPSAATVNVPAAEKKAKPKTKADRLRAVIYPEPQVQVCQGIGAVTVEQAKELIGWDEETADVKFGADCVPELTALVGRKVRLHNDTRNRPLQPSWLATLRQEHLQRRWRMNWETIIVGRTGEVLSGQHRLLSLILAELERIKDLEGAGHWKANWPGPVTMESLVVLGAEEDDETFRTLNCGMPASLPDVLYRSELMKDVKPDDRRKMSRLADYAVKLLWDRTGLVKDAYAPRRTHGESIEFVQNHPRLLQAVKHIYEENSDGRIGLVVSPGTAAGLLYLFGACRSDGDGYRAAEVRKEESLDLSAWDRAEEFFALLGGTGPDLRTVRAAVGDVYDETKGTGTTAEVVAVLVKAWEVFVEGKNPTPASVRLNYETNEDGEMVWTDRGCPPDVGGIDLGPGGGSKEDEEETEEEAPAPKPKIVPSRREADADKAAADKAAKALSPDSQALLRQLREKHAGKVLLFQAKGGQGWRAFEQDAKLIKALAGLTPVKNGVLQVAFPAAKAKDVLAALQEAGHRVAAVFETSDGPEVEDYPTPEPNGTERPTPTPKKRGSKK